MPVTAPYDIVETVIQTARVRLNDAIASINGDILTDAAAFTQTAVNAAWRRLQEFLANQGFQALNREKLLAAVPACTQADQGIFVSFNWVSYFDGSNNQNAPVLPQDMISPRGLQERISGTTGAYTPIDQCFDGLPTVPKQALNKLWEWRQETIYMPGATGQTDIRLLYAGYIGDFETTGVAPNQINWTQQPVPIMRSLTSFAWYICSEVARARGDLDAGWFDQQGQIAAEYIFNRDYQPGRALYKPSELGKMTDASTPTDGPTGPKGTQQGLQQGAQKG